MKFPTLGRICSHSHGNRRSAATENYDYAIVRLGASHVLFRLARSIIDLLAPQPPSTQLPSDNEGPTSPSHSRSPPKFEWLDRTLCPVFFSAMDGLPFIFAYSIHEHACVEVSWVSSP